MCTQFCTWRALNLASSKDQEAMERALTEAQLHIIFAASLYEEQLAAGHYFLHEHPMWATSWQIKEIEELMKQDGVTKVRGDQCQFGAEIKSGIHEGDPINKPTGFLTNSPCVARALAVTCEGQGGQCSRAKGGQHRLCSGSHARAAATYPRGLCRAILRGVRDQLRQDGHLKNGCFGIQAEDDEVATEHALRGEAQGYSGTYRDDLTGQILKDEWVHEARAKELEFFHAKSVWLKIPKAHA